VDGVASGSGGAKVRYVTVSSWADPQIHASRILRLEESRDTVVQRLDGALNMIAGLAEGQRRLETQVGEVLAEQHRFAHGQRRMENQLADVYGEITQVRLHHKRTANHVADLRVVQVRMEAGLTEVRGEVAELRTGQEQLRSEVAELRAGQARLASELVGARFGLATIRAEMQRQGSVLDRILAAVTSGEFVAGAP
jgi:chromosome segregation ATPase